MRARFFLALIILLSLLALSCDDDGNMITPPSESPTAISGLPGTPPPRPTPNPTMQAQLTATAAACPVAADTCAFARQIETALKNGDVRSIVTSARAEEYTCPSQRLPGAGGPYPLCDGAAGGEVRQGYKIAYLASEGVVVNQQGLQEALEVWARAAMPAMSDAYGSGAGRLFTIGCPADRNTCANQPAFVFSQLRGVPSRNQLILYFDRNQRARAQLIWTVIGPLLEPQQQEAALRGGTVPVFLTPPGWPPITTFYRIDP